MGGVLYYFLKIFLNSEGKRFIQMLTEHRRVDQWRIKTLIYCLV
jgi:hypothetical protein